MGNTYCPIRCRIHHWSVCKDSQHLASSLEPPNQLQSSTSQREPSHSSFRQSCSTTLRRDLVPIETQWRKDSALSTKKFFKKLLGRAKIRRGCWLQKHSGLFWTLWRTRCETTMTAQLMLATTSSEFSGATGICLDDRSDMTTDGKQCSWCPPIPRSGIPGSTQSWRLLRYEGVSLGAKYCISHVH
jgi:hypothetical protein